ncbi:hypothetical protein GF351_03515 [Candidatus Woesearchaeota archaeon]|nr:hypothetical protein [Candidatus Woesearchaeota archaeon]
MEECVNTRREETIKEETIRKERSDMNTSVDLVVDAATSRDLNATGHEGSPKAMPGAVYPHGVEEYSSGEGSPIAMPGVSYPTGN